MKTKTIILVLISTSVILTSCCKMEDYVTPSAEITLEEKNFSDFSQLDISDAFEVFVTFSEAEESVQVEANKNLQGHIQISQYDSRLFIKLDDNINIKHGDATLNIHIKMHQLTEVIAEGATQVNLQNELVGTNFHLQLTGASSFNGNLQLNNFYSKLHGASNIDISGSADSFEIEATGASNMEGFDFETSNFSADLEGASNASLTIIESINIIAEGASNLYYKGDGVVRSQNLSGASKIYKMD